MLSLEERLDNIDAGIVNIYNQLDELATFDELDAVVDQVFDDIKDLVARISAVKNNMAIVEEILSTATRK